MAVIVTLLLTLKTKTSLLAGDDLVGVQFVPVAHEPPADVLAQV
jgi:hypothetical protein